jgi:hypothetical protein
VVSFLDFVKFLIIFNNVTMKKIQLFLLVFICLQINVLAQKKINLNKENTEFQINLKTTSSDVPQQYMKEAKAGRIFAINPALQRTGSVNVEDMVDLQLFESNSYAAQISKIDTDVNGTLTLTLRLSDYPTAFGLITTADNGKSMVYISIPELNEEYLTHTSIYSNSSYLLELDKEKADILECESSAFPEIPEGVQVGEDSISPPITTRATCSPATTDENAPANIDIVMFYTPAAASWSQNSNGGIANTIALSRGITNEVLVNSQVNATITLVHSEQVNYTESGSSNTDLDRFTNNFDGYMDEIHAVRKQKNADIAVLAGNLTDYGGLGWVLNSLTGSPDHAFNIVRVQQIGHTTTSIHEIGHNMGMCHNSEDNNITNPLYPYALGWHWIGDDTKEYGSVMSYIGTEARYFSNPNTSYKGQPTGVDGLADNAQVFRKTKHQVAFYSDKIANLPDAPTVTINSVSCNGFNVSWTLVAGATGYQFCYRQTSTTGSYYFKNFDASTSGYVTSESFSTGVEYTCWVIAINACGDGTKSAEITFTPACAATVSSVSVSPSTVSVAKGGTQSFSATVSGTGTPAQTVTWSVSGKSSATTTISTAGLLTVASDETATSLTVKATSTVDVSKNGTATVTVTTSTPTYTITATDDAHSAITPNGAVTVNANASQTFNWSFDNGYEKNQLKVDNVVTNVSGTSYPFTNVTSTHTIGITSKATVYTITYNLNGGSGANDNTYTIESPAITLPTPTKSGNTYQGWGEYANFSGGRVYSISAGST